MRTPTKTIEKSPAQLAQWAAYEALTAKRAEEASLNAERQRRVARIADEAKKWDQAELIRRYVAAVMAAAPASASESDLQKLFTWRDEALKVAELVDPVPELLLTIFAAQL